ncbi:MAG: hypothetical protein U0Q22_18900 [Acidimicrobiales bacterium]
MSSAPHRRRFAAALVTATALFAVGCVPDSGGTPTTSTTTVPESTTTSTSTTSTTTTSTTSTTTTTSTSTSTTSTTTTTAPPVDHYDITIDDGGVLTPSQRAQLDLAVARVERVVAAGLPDVPVSIGAGLCLPNGPAINTTVDDLLVQVDLEDLGGNGGNGVLAAAGPCKSRTAPLGGLPVACGLSYDTSSLDFMEANGILDDVSTHELLHCLGIGTKWGSLVTNQFGADPRYNGAAAVAEWHALGGTGGVPLEPFLGGHWSESVFGDELMTPVSPVGFAPLSRLTIAALADLGYSVDLTAADPFTLPTPGAALRAAPPATVSLANDVRH